MADKYRCGLLFGAPGVGKGTQGERLGAHEGFLHLATGDIFRSLDKESEMGKKFLEYSSRGELVPDDLTITLWRDYVARLVKDGAYDPENDVLILDGMPRSARQAEILDDAIEPLIIFHIVASDRDEIVKRMKLRAEKQGRHDDADETVIRRRFEVYAAETAPVLAHYDKRLIVEVDGMGTIDEVSNRIWIALMPLVGRAQH